MTQLAVLISIFTFSLSICCSTYFMYKKTNDILNSIQENSPSNLTIQGEERGWPTPYAEGRNESRYSG